MLKIYKFKNSGCHKAFLFEGFDNHGRHLIDYSKEPMLIDRDNQTTILISVSKSEHHDFSGLFLFKNGLYILNYYNELRFLQYWEEQKL